MGIVRFFLASVLAAHLFSASTLSLGGSANENIPNGFVIERLTENLELPTGFAFAPDGRIFIIEKAGRVKIWKDGVLYGQPLIDLRDEVNDSIDRGLIGIAVDPKFASNGFIYLSYVYDAPNQTRDADEQRNGRVVRFTVNDDTALPRTATVILDDFLSNTSQHATGALRFAQDGSLFAGFGDGMLSQGAQDGSLRAQQLDNIQGKLLRIDSNGNGVKGNPFYDERNPRSARSRIWAYGFRNPFRFGVHPKSGAPYVGDVGWNTSESLMRATAGANFGWPCVEGDKDIAEFQAKPECKGVNAKTSAPKDFVYAHNQANASIVAGDFNFGSNFPKDMQGDFFYADYSKFFIRRAKTDGQGRLTQTFDFIADGGQPVDLQFGPDGALYWMSIYAGGLRRVFFKDGKVGALAQTQPTIGAPLIQSPSDGDTFFRGETITLKIASVSDCSAKWIEKRRSVLLDIKDAVFTMPRDIGDEGAVEVLCYTQTGGKIQAQRINLYAPTSDGYIRSWWILGGFPYRSLNDDTIGEANFVFNPNDKSAWRIRSTSRAVNFKQLVTPNPGNPGVLADKSTAYAFVWVWSPDERKGLLGMNSDDGIAAWLNGKEVWRNKTGRFMPDDKRDIDLPPIELKKGYNALLVKVDTNGGDWQFKARFLKPDGSIMPDVLAKTSLK
jgi:glucose/arabinose dehydrogenase